MKRDALYRRLMTTRIRGRRRGSHLAGQGWSHLAKVIASAAALAAGLALAPEVNAQVLGGVDSNVTRKYCGQKLGLNVLAAAGPADLFNAYSWRCGRTPWIWDGGGVDFNRVCTMQYGAPAYAYTTNPKWAHSWMCRR